MAPADTVAEAERKFTRTSQIYEFKNTEDTASKKLLSDEAEWAAGLLQRLTSADGEEAMRPGIFNACQGLAFIRVDKAALGLTVAKGSGFLVAKLDQDRFGHSLWSPPVFFTVSQLGVGVAAGYQRVESCLALTTTAAVKKFTASSTRMGTDLLMYTTDGGMAGVPAGTFGRTSHMDVSADGGESCFCYSQSNGALVNLSINGTETHPNKDVNEKLYKALPLEDVLAGKTRTFPEFLPLYRKIQELSVKALGGA